MMFTLGGCDYSVSKSSKCAFLFLMIVIINGRQTIVLIWGL